MKPQKLYSSARNHLRFSSGPASGSRPVIPTTGVKARQTSTLTAKKAFACDVLHGENLANGLYTLGNVTDFSQCIARCG
jgi:hypothetical protein